MRLDLGCGKQKREDCLGVDICEDFHPDIVADIRQPLPLPDACADYIVCSHVLEHLYGEEWKFVIWEIARLLKPGGLFEIRVPHPADDNAMIHGHVYVLTPYLWNQIKVDKWFGDALVFDEIKETINLGCLSMCIEMKWDFSVVSPYLRNAYQETVVTGHKQCQ